MNGAEAELYDEYGGLTGRLKAGTKAFKYLFYEKALESFSKSLEQFFKRAEEVRFLGVYASSMRDALDGLKTRYKTEKHKYGRIFGRVNIPLIGKFFQNFWSLYHLSRGLTNIDCIYTIRLGEVEYPFVVETKDETFSTADIKDRAKDALGREREYASDVVNRVFKNRSKYENVEAVNAGAYLELTDYDLLQVKDPSTYPEPFMAYELWCIGRFGRREFVTTIKDGFEIYRYMRPSNLDMLRSYLEEDFRYTVHDLVIGVTEKALPGLAKQRLYEDEVKRVIGSVIRHHRDLRVDGVPNPITFYIRDHVELPSR